MKHPRFTKRAFIVPFFILLYILFSYFYLAKVPSEDDLDSLRNSVNTIMFAVIAISSVGMGLSYSDHELVKLKEKKKQILDNQKLRQDLRDTIGLDINDRIETTERIFGKHQRYNFIIIVISFLIVLFNEVYSTSNCQFWLKYIGFTLSFFYLASFLWLMIYKRSLIDIVVNQYDKAIKKVDMIDKGDFRGIMPH